jgi:hypothetical protein
MSDQQQHKRRVTKMSEYLTLAEIDALIKGLTDDIASGIHYGMSTVAHDSIVRLTNDLQVISNLLCRSMPLRRAEWVNRYV